MKIFKNEIESFSNIIDTLMMLNRDNILIFNDELLVFVLENETSTEYFSKNKYLKKTVDMQYFVFNKDGVLINETVDLVAEVRSKKGTHLGYILRLMNIRAISDIDIFDNEIYYDKAIVFYDKSIQGFVCNNIENISIRENCLCIDKDLNIQGDSGGYILRMKGKTYSFSRSILEDLDGNSHKYISNIGRFTER